MNTVLESDIDRILSWDRNLDDYDYFELLGVAETCSAAQADDAYRRFARIFHPDNFPCVEASVQAALTRLFQRAVEARQVLTNPDLRSKYRTLIESGIKRFPEEQQHQSPGLTNIDLDAELPKLHISCRSGGAKLRAMAAASAWQRGSIDDARKALHDALTFDGQTNPAIQGCLDAIAAR
ncbi:MAG TPA: DnaJ domain-containing protein [Polyangiaceae bacterium]